MYKVPTLILFSLVYIEECLRQDPSSWARTPLRMICTKKWKYMTNILLQGSVCAVGTVGKPIINAFDPHPWL